MLISLTVLSLGAMQCVEGRGEPLPRTPGVSLHVEGLLACLHLSILTLFLMG